MQHPSHGADDGAPDGPRTPALGRCASGIEAHDRAALERLLRYGVRPPFAMDRLRKEGAALVYRRGQA